MPSDISNEDGGSLSGASRPPDRLRELLGIAHELGPEEALWLSGYLAALGTRPAHAGTSTPDAEGGQAGHRADAVQLTVLYATETGNARGVAERLAAEAVGSGLAAEAVDVAKFRTKDLARATHLALVAATHGEGDPPEPAVGFFEFLWSRRAPRLDGTQFAVLALGDSSYVEFCKAGRDLDERLEELGASRLLDRVDCDVDYRDDAEDWVTRILEILGREASCAPAAGTRVTGPMAVASRPDGADPGSIGGIAALVLGARGTGNGVGAEPSLPTEPAYSARKPYRAEILESTLLTGLRSTKETRHLEIAVDDPGIRFEPGDSLGILPRNEPAVVEAALDALDADPSDVVEVGGRERPLEDALAHHLELTRVTVGFLESWAEAVASRDLGALLAGDRRPELKQFLKCHQIPDILRRYPLSGLDPQDFVDMLRRLQPRLYSIASSDKWTPGQIDLAVAVTRFTADGKPRNGAASSYLADRRAPGEMVEVFVDHNSGFRLPEAPGAPVIMVGSGTGVAPFRAFLQDRAETGAGGRNWLFFGERSFREDFLYQLEWQRFLEDGLLTRMDVAFSRDQADKVYVQHRIREQAAEVYAWLEEGAYFYVCGDAEGMAPEVDLALREVVRSAGGRSKDAAAEYLTSLRSEGRYQKDVY